MKISVSSYSFQQYINAKKMTQIDTVRYANDLGINAIDFTDIIGESYEEQVKNAELIRNECEKYKTKVVSYTIGGKMYNGSDAEDEKEIERLTGQLKIAKILGADNMRHDIVYQLSKTGNGRSFALMLPTVAKNVRKLTEIAAEMGIKTCTENHGFISQDSDRIERLHAAVAHDNFGLLIDIGNFICADEDSAVAVSRLANNAIHVHAKDFYRRTYLEGPADGYFATRGMNYVQGCVIGDGVIPVKQCIAILKKAGYDGYVTIEFEGACDCLEGIKRGKEYLEKII